MEAKNNARLLWLLLLLQCLLDVRVSGFSRYRPLQHIATPSADDAGTPLFLTPFIEAGLIAEGQAVARVKPFAGNVRSYAGFLTVNKAYNSNLFFWFFPAQRGSHKPVALWLQGGPGATSLFGVFEETGPYFIDNGQPGLRNYSWTKELSMLYIDNPVGTGFSFTDEERGYVTTQEQVGNDLYSALIQFFQLFPEYRKQAFFLTGESYAGKYLPAIGYTIHKRNPTAPFKINLQGLAIGNGLCDPEHMVGHLGLYLNQLGLLDANALSRFQMVEEECLSLIEERRWDEAGEAFDQLAIGRYHKTTFFQNITGFTFHLNYLQDTTPPTADGSGFAPFVQLPEIRASLHVGNATFHTDNKAGFMLKGDKMKSVRPWIEELLAHYRFLFYNGQLDIIVAYPLTVNFLQALKFDAAREYATAPRHIWTVGDHIAGYAKTAGNLTEILVRNAGHMVPADQPAWAFDMVYRFTRNLGYS